MDTKVYEDTSSPTAAIQSVFYVAAVAAQERRQVMTADIAGLSNLIVGVNQLYRLSAPRPRKRRREAGTISERQTPLDTWLQQDTVTGRQVRDMDVRDMDDRRYDR